MTEQLIQLDAIDDNPFQDRGVYTDIDSLGRTIATHGLQEPAKARQAGGRYQLKFGHRRKRAFEWLSANWKKEGLPERYEGYTVMPLDVEEIPDDAMFDGVVIENVHRDDLKPTEVARLLKRYMEVHPNATSKQVGLVFNMNEATVRGTVRLLELPAQVQTRLDDGTITQGTARLLHSMQKIAPEKMIVATLERVVKEGDNTLPGDVIEEEINQLDNAVELWNDNHRDGKPRAGYHGWLLDMKNFPNRLLVSLNGQTANLETEQVEHLTNPPVCTACPFYTKLHGSHYCGVKVCYQRKTEAWIAYSVEQASKRTGIAVYVEADGSYRPLDWNDKSLFEKKDKDLRLMHGRGYQSFPGLDDDLVLVVATGDALNKMKKISLGTKGGKKSEKEKAAMRAMKLYRPKRKELLWEFTACAKSMFDAVPHDLLLKMTGWQYMGIELRPPDDAIIPDNAKVDNVKSDYLRRSLIWRLCGGDSYHETLNLTDLTKISDRLEKLAKGWGVKYPKSLAKMATQFQAEIVAVARGVATETKK